SHSETALGMTDRARRRVADVIARFSLLPMQEVALPRTLDAVVVTLLGAKTPVRAAVALGCAESVPFPVESAIPRASVLEELAESVEAALGTDEAVRLRAEGAALDPLQFLEQARGWLLE